MAAGTGAEPQPLADFVTTPRGCWMTCPRAPAPRRWRWTGLRREYLARQLQAVDARLRMLAGERFTFDEESRALYDAVAPTHDEAYFARTLSELDARLPGAGPVAERHEAFKRDFVIPPRRLDAVFQAAIDACRARTREHLPLPADERFTVEYVTGKSWSGYNWYQGGTTSLIQVNTDLPIYIDRAIDLAATKAIPGTTSTTRCSRSTSCAAAAGSSSRCIALFSPQSLIAEGTANFGIDVAFPGRRARGVRARSRCSRSPVSTRRARRSTTTRSALTDRLALCRQRGRAPVLERRDLAREARPTGWRRTRCSRARAPSSACGSSTSTAATSSTTTSGRTSCAPTSSAAAARADDPARRWAEFGELLSSPRLPSGLAARSCPAPT